MCIVTRCIVCCLGLNVGCENKYGQLIILPHSDRIYVGFENISKTAVGFESITRTIC